VLYLLGVQPLSSFPSDEKMFGVWKQRYLMNHTLFCAQLIYSSGCCPTLTPIMCFMYAVIIWTLLLLDLGEILCSLWVEVKFMALDIIWTLFHTCLHVSCAYFWYCLCIMDVCQVFVSQYVTCSRIQIQSVHLPLLDFNSANKQLVIPLPRKY